MFKSAKPLFITVETPLHAGSGNDLGIVDLPIQREKHTDYPKIEASGIKGCLREAFTNQPPISWAGEVLSKTDYGKAVKLAFGPDPRDEGGERNLYAGALGFTDARLLLFPVKSVKGVFAWVTCPAVLEQLKQDLSMCSPTIPFVNTLPEANRVATNSGLFIKDDKIVLEEYTFSVSKQDSCDTLATWMATNVFPPDASYGYWREKMKRDIVVLTDDDFRDFVTLSTEVIARIRINSGTGIVQKGALWYEEYLPSDSILYSLALTTPIFQEKTEEKGIFGQGSDEESAQVMAFFEAALPEIIQIGGNATIGKGFARTHIGANGGTDV